MLRKIGFCLLVLSFALTVGCQQGVKVTLKWSQVPFPSNPDAYVDLDLHVVGVTGGADAETAPGPFYRNLVKGGKFHIFSFQRVFDEKRGAFMDGSVFEGTTLQEYNEMVFKTDPYGQYSTANLDRDVNNPGEFTPGKDPETITLFQGSKAGVYKFTVVNCDNNVMENGSWYDAAPTITVKDGTGAILNNIEAPVDAGDNLYGLNFWKAFTLELSSDPAVKPVIIVVDKDNAFVNGDDLSLDDLDW